MTKEERNALMRQFRADAEEGNKATFKRMSKCERFKIGKQWDNDVRARNKAKRKFSLTINRILPTVLQVNGTEVQNPRDIRVHHTKGGTKTVAKLLTALAKHTMDTSYARRQGSMMFDDGNTTGRGWIGADFDYSKDPLNADIVVKKYDPFSILPDPNRRHYDLNVDAKFVIIDEWIDKEKIEAQNPGKKDKLANANYAAYTDRGYLSTIVNFIFHRGGPSGTQDDYRDHSNDEDEGLTSSRAKYDYRRSTYWWKQWKKGLYIQRLDNPLQYWAKTKPADMKAARRIAEENPDQVRIIDKDRDGNPLSVAVLNKTVMVGDEELSHTEDPFNGINLFPIVEYNPYFQNGYEFGLVENLIGPQEQLNWSWSLELNLLKQLANAWWKIRKSVGRFKEWLEDHGSEDGIVIEESQGGGKVEKGEMNPFPVGMDIVTEKGSRHISEISNVRLESPQTDKDRVAAAIRLKQASAFTGSASLFGNYDYTIELLGALVVALIRKTETFSEDEIRAIVDDEDLIDAELLAQARQMIVQQFGNAGYEIPEQPTPPDMNLLQQFAPEVQQAAMNEHQQIMEVYQRLMAQIDEVARPIAEQLLFAEMKNLQKGRYGIKISLAPMAETMKTIKALEKFELNKVLIESGHQPLSRKTLIQAVDPSDMEAILAEG